MSDSEPAKCKPATCPACGGELARPSMMTGQMRCTSCFCSWDGEWLSRFERAVASCRRAFTMIVPETRLPSVFIAAMRLGSVDKARVEEQQSLERIVRARSAVKAARTVLKGLFEEAGSE